MATPWSHPGPSTPHAAALRMNGPGPMNIMVAIWNDSEFMGPGLRRDDAKECQSNFFPAVSGSQNRLTISAIATTAIVYQRPEKGSPVRATIYWLMKGRKPPK